MCIIGVYPEFVAPRIPRGKKGCKKRKYWYNKKIMGNFLRASWEVGKIALIAFILVIGLRVFVFQPFLVRGASMEPNFHDWDYLIVDEISYRFRAPERGEVIVFQFPNDPSQRYIKRIIGLPGETIHIEQGEVTLYSAGEKIELNEQEYLESPTTLGSVRVVLGEGEYFVMGDNRQYSSDSRAWGVLPEDKIIGKTFIRVLPAKNFTVVKLPNY
jgi:signal peptidase I